MATKKNITPDETAASAETKTVLKKAPASKTKAPADNSAKKTSAGSRGTGNASAKGAEPEFFVQYLGKDVAASDVTEQVRNIWTEEMGRKASEIKDLKIYFKTEENRAYYVINQDVSGSVEI